MNASELRLGNYLLGYDNNYFTWDYGHYDLCSKGIDADELGMPIELTEEILLKCGFEKREDGDYNLFKNSEVDIVICSDFSSWKCDGINFSVNYIKHLHQLQNLYWCLCGKELKIEL